MQKLLMTCAALGGLALSAGLAELRAQCPDGTPPPCGVRAAQPATRPVAPPPPGVRARRLLLLPFRNVTRGPAQEWLVSGGPILLASALGQFRDLTVVPDEQLVLSMRRASMKADAAPDAAQLRQIANETGGWTAISGTVIASGSRVRIGLQALDIATTQVLTRVEGDVAAEADVGAAFDTLAARLLAITGVRSGNTVDLGALTTRSVDAFRYYVAGIEALRRAESREALDDFRKAVRIDSTFALAWARLGLASIIWDASTGLDPRSPAVIAVDRAARFAERLPRREAQLIRATQAAIGGRIGMAKATLDSIIATDSSDVEAREWRALAEMSDRVLVDTLALQPRLHGSWNAAVRMFEDVLQRDAGRGSAYQWLVYIYINTAGGVTPQPGIPALRREASSMAALLNPSTFTTVVPVLRDSIEFMTPGGWNGLSPQAASVLKQRGVEAARRWSDRWLTTSPENSMAHWWAAALADRAGDYGRVLQELSLADSARLTFQRESYWLWRMRALAGLGRLKEASSLADSIRATPGLVLWVGQNLANVTIANHLIARRWDAAMAVMDSTRQRFAVRTPRCNYFASMMEPGNFGLPTSLRAAIMDTLANHFADVASNVSAGQCALLLATGIARDSAGLRRDFAMKRALMQFDSVSAIDGPKGDVLLLKTSALVGNIDSTAWAGLAQNQRYVRLMNEWIVPRRFEGGPVVVAGDSLSVSFRWISPEPAVWDVPESFLGFTLRAGITIGRGDDTTGVIVYAERPGQSWRAAVRGGVAEIAAAVTNRGAGLLRPVTWLRAWSWPADLRVEGDVIRLVIRGEVVDAIRSARPATARFGVGSCGVVTGGLCTPRLVNIDYR